MAVIVSETVLLVGRCQRRRHVLFKAVETPDMLLIDAPLLCVDRESDTWVPDRRQLAPLGRRVGRYGCKCTATALVHDSEIFDRIRRGTTEWLIACYNISEK